MNCVRAGAWYAPPVITYVQRNWARLLVSPTGTFVHGVPLRVVGFGLISVVVWWLALYSAGAYGSRRWRDLVRAVNVVAALSFLTYRLVFVAGTLASGSLLLRGIFLVLFNVAFVVSAWIFGDVVAERRDYERALVDRARQLEREREEKARQAVFDERLRIARDLHDVVAHHVSVMGVQAGAARRVLTRRPAQAARALAAIEETSRQAVTELQRMLGFLRREGEQPDLAPQPRLGRLDALLRDLAGGALHVQVIECGTPRELPPTVEVSAYRIVQEALTNVLKHSTAERVVVRLVYEPRSFAVEITDDGRPRDAARPAGGGHGVLGMRERTALHHGELVAAPLDSGGYRVRATFPVEAAVS